MSNYSNEGDYGDIRGLFARSNLNPGGGDEMERDLSVLGSENIWSPIGQTRQCVEQIIFLTDQLESGGGKASFFITILDKLNPETWADDREQLRALVEAYVSKIGSGNVGFRDPVNRDRFLNYALEIFGNISNTLHQHPQGSERIRQTLMIACQGARSISVVRDYLRAGGQVRTKLPNQRGEQNLQVEIKQSQEIKVALHKNLKVSLKEAFNVFPALLEQEKLISLLQSIADQYFYPPVVWDNLIRFSLQGSDEHNTLIDLSGIQKLVYARFAKCLNQCLQHGAVDIALICFVEQSRVLQALRRRKDRDAVLPKQHSGQTTSNDGDHE